MTPRAFDSQATSEEKTYTEKDRPVEIVVAENPDDGDAPVTIKVTRERTYADGSKHRYTLRVPQALVNDNWPGGQKTFKDWLLTLIGAAE